MENKLPYNKTLSFLNEDDSGELKLFLSDKKIDDLKERIHHLMVYHKPFLKEHYSMVNMAHDLQMPAHQLSAFLNLVLNQRYNDLVNKYRIGYCLELLNTMSGTLPKVHQLAYACGYSNRNTFINAFKKYVHTTPFEYISNLKKKTGLWIAFP